MKPWSNRYARLGLALFVAVLLIAALSGSVAAAGPVYHTVLPGQTLYSISMHYGVNQWTVACANGLYNPNHIYAGMRLMIPYGWSGNCLDNFKAPVVIIVQPVIQQPAPCTCVYRVRWGDTLFSIAWRHHTTWQELARINHLPNPNVIFAGMILRVPGCSSVVY